ncbi:LysR family transcriptional regulator [Pantoea sp. S18]|uniref:LysR family transcriptional regulator n=1 Tax=Pantoea sp. S18 TaxID=3019892 RepID=UPI002B1F3281|nr:LysR family transcriptional regulator [Pantoea sp. S18]MEA5105718.1 LysR family transcriptional regulator [Pantoea sp. S18]
MKSINELTEVLPGLILFVKVAETGSFSSAGRALSMTPSSVSRMIDRLEKRLNLVLFLRTTRALTITESGVEIYNQALTVISATNALFARAESFGDKPQGLLRVTAPNTLGKILLTPFLPSFLTKYPDINVDLKLTDTVISVSQSQCDVALRITDAPPEENVARKLMEIDYVLVCSANYGRQLPNSPSGLLAHSIFSPDESQFQREWYFYRNKTTEKVVLTPRLTINYSDAMIEAVLSGVGIALVPMFIAKSYLANGRLIQVLPNWDIVTPKIMTAYAITLPGKLIPLKTRLFVDGFIDWVRTF